MKRLLDTILLPLLPIVMILDNAMDLLTERRIRETRSIILALGIGGVSLAMMLFIMRTK